MSSPHIATAENTSGTTLDILIRPNISLDAKCNDLIRQVVESIVVAFPQETQRAIEDSIVRAIADAEGRFAGVNFLKISTDQNNSAQEGTDGGIFVEKRPFATATAATTAGSAGNFTLPLSGFNNTSYQVSVEPLGDPGAFRWWVTSKTQNSVSIGFHAANAVSLNVNAHG
jgi:hypothetical protein